MTEFDPEIERTLRLIRTAKRRLFDTSFVEDSIGVSADHSTYNSLVSVSRSSSSSISELDSVSNDSALPENIANTHDKILKELLAPNVNYQALAIQYLDLDADSELKSGLIHLLPKFHGLAGEDPHKHLKEFHTVCSTKKPHGVDEDHIKLRAFPFSLVGAAKEWLYCLHSSSIICWQDMKRLFLEKFFPASRAAAIRKKICGIRQIIGETFHEYWERFKKLCASCPHHQISD